MPEVVPLVALPRHHAGMLAARSDSRGLVAAVCVALFATGAGGPRVARTIDTDASVSIIIRPGHEPELVAYRRIDDPAWKIVKPRGNRYELGTQLGRYTVVIVCPAIGDVAQVSIYQLGYSDVTTLTAPCRADTRPRTRTPVRFVDPATSLWVGDEHASVTTDGNGRIVDRNSEVMLAADRFDWLVMSDRPFRIALTHDVQASPKTVKADLRTGRPVDQLLVRAPAGTWAMVSFLSRNGTDFTGLGESPTARARGDGSAKAFDIVPYAVRAPGDRDIVMLSDSDAFPAYAVAAATSVDTASRPIALTLPTARPHAELRMNGDLHWRNAGDPDLTEINQHDDWLNTETYLSRRWLARASMVHPVDLSTIPGWRWPEPQPSSAWVTWAWTSDPSSLPFDRFTPPLSTTYRTVSVQVTVR